MEKQTLEELSAKFFDANAGLEQNEDMDCLARTLADFCRTGTKQDAFCVYYAYCEIFSVFGSGYDTMHKLLELLSDHEFHSGELLSKHRDHYSHSVYVFALGLAVYACDKTFADIFDAFYGQKGGKKGFLYLWGLTALFHDIGYPFQLAHEQVKTYTEDLWGEKNPARPFVSYENMQALTALCDAAVRTCKYPLVYKTAGELLAFHVAARLGYSAIEVFETLNKRYTGQADYMDHGYFGAVLLLKQLCDAGTPISDEISDALTAILLHNSLNRYGLKTARPLAAAEHPLAYLLVLCDELQDWNRTAFGLVSKKDPLAWRAWFFVKAGTLAVQYDFDSFTVPVYDFSAQSADGAAQTESTRPNKNVVKIQSGKFVDGLNSLLRSHTRIVIEAVEAPKDKNGRNYASSDKLINLCDFAVAIHKSYQKEYGGPDFKDLPLEFKLSNIEQAKSYAGKLELINCFYSDKEMDYPVVKGFTHLGESEDRKRDDMGFLAREEHLRWVREKLKAGWKYGTDYTTREERNRKRIHKDLVPYDCLSEEDRQKDELMVKNMVPFLYEYGHGVRIYSYRTGRKPVLDIAGCGHRTVRQTEALKRQIKDVLLQYDKEYRVVVRTNFAFGADQLIAECANELGITIKAVLPFPYEEYIAKIKEDARQYKYRFTEDDEYRMRHLLAQTVSCKVVPDPEYTYLAASKYIINKCKKMIVLWDGVQTILEDENGKPVNQGGTYHNICIAKNSRGLREEDIHTISCER